MSRATIQDAGPPGSSARVVTWRQFSTLHDLSLIEFRDGRARVDLVWRALAAWHEGGKAKKRQLGVPRLAALTHAASSCMQSARSWI